MRFIATSRDDREAAHDKSKLILRRDEVKNSIFNDSLLETNENQNVLGWKGLNDEFLTEDLDEYDALNDETFGQAATNDDWEAAHEKSELRRDVVKNSIFSDSLLETDASQKLLGRRGFYDEYLSDFEDDDYDALSDGSFGQAAANDDWEEAREKSELILRKEDDDSILDSLHEIAYKCISVLGLDDDDDLDDPTIMPVACNFSAHPSSSASPPPPAVLETEDCQSVSKISVSKRTVAQCPGQQSSPGTFSGASSVEALADNAKPHFSQFLLLLHVLKCEDSGIESNGAGKRCSLPHCPAMQQVLRTVALNPCRERESCTCQSDSILPIQLHWKNCSRSDCHVCLPYKQECDGRLQQAVDEPWFSPPNQQPPVQLRPLEQESNAGAITDATAKSFKLGEDLQSEVRYSNPALPDVIPVPCDKVPDNPTTSEDWRQSVTRDERHQFVQRLARAISAGDSHNGMMICLMAFLRKVEGDAYEAANSKDEYNKLVLDGCLEINNELAEDRQKSL